MSEINETDIITMAFRLDSQIEELKSQKQVALEALWKINAKGPWATSRGTFRLVKITDKKTREERYNLVRLTKSPKKIDV